MKKPRSDEYSPRSEFRPPPPPDTRRPLPYNHSYLKDTGSRGYDPRDYDRDRRHPRGSFRGGRGGRGGGGGVGAEVLPPAVALQEMIPRMTGIKVSLTSVPKILNRLGQASSLLKQL